MVIVKLMGGLGNQMFQYAAAKAISKNDISFDSNFLNNNLNSSDQFTARKYELYIFSNLKIRPLSKQLLRFILSNNQKILFLKKILSFLFKKITYINDINFVERIKSINNKETVYLEGYFQNPRYFEHIRASIIEDFKFPKVKLPLNTFVREIEDSNSIAIHIRRGDYLKPDANRLHGILSLAHYKSAVNFINSKLENPIYFIFSDDPEWCKNNLTFINNQHLISGNNEAWIDMHLMSLCKHQIIANSSFSWWAAWLNQNPDKIVIAPKKWFNEIDTEIIPKEWISL